MGWLSRFLTSSIGQKLIMSLSGIFLMVFLIIHLLGNLQLLKSDGGEAFNTYAYLMTHFVPIKIVSYVLYLSILVHAIQGTLLFINNRGAKGSKYAVNSNIGLHWASRYMMHFGAIIFIFLMIHLYQFWLQMKMGVLEQVEYASLDHKVYNLYKPCIEVFSNPLFVAFYVVSMVVLAFHLAHGFWSAFQTLGISHKKYQPLIKFVAMVYSILIPLGFAAIPVIVYFSNQ